MHCAVIARVSGKLGQDAVRLYSRECEAQIKHFWAELRPWWVEPLLDC